MMIGLLKIKYLEITWYHSLILEKAITIMIKTSMNSFIRGCILTTLYENTRVSHVKCITVITHVHLVGIEVLSPI